MAGPLLLQSAGATVEPRTVRPRRSRPERAGGGGGGGDRDGGDDDDGHGGGGGPGGGPERPSLPGAAELALRLALVAIASLFLVFLALFVHVRATAVEWPPANSPPPPIGLWGSTFVLAVSSLCLARASLLARRGDRDALRRWLTASLLSGVGFLAVQAVVWSSLLADGLRPSTNGYGALFYAVTGLHGAHVGAGLAYLALLRRRASRRHAEGPSADGVRLVGVYWHFMGVVWVAVLALLWMPGGGTP